MHGASNLIVLLQPWAASQDLWQPELPDSTLHVTDLSLSWWRGLDPLGRLPADTTDHIRMCEGLWRPLLWLSTQGRGDRLCDSRVQRRGSAGDDEVAVGLASSWAIARPGTGERRVGV